MDTDIEKELEQLEIIKEKLLTILKDYDKVDTWLNCSNPNFGYTKPITLINVGRGDKVLLFIEAAIEGY